MKTIALMLALSVVALAQEAPALDATTKELVSSWIAQDQAAAKTVQARIDAMLKTDEGKAYQAALNERQAAQKAINAKVAAKVPGFQVDFQNGRLTPVTTATAPK